MFEALGIEHVGLFVLAGWLLNLTPGPDVLYIVSNALRSGTRAGVVAALGITAGCFVHIFAAAVGVSALLATSAAAFTALKWIGAAYLLYMGVRLLFSRGAAVQSADTSTFHAQAQEFGREHGYGQEHGQEHWQAGGKPQSATLVAADSSALQDIFRRGFLTNALNPKVALFFLAFVPQFIAPGAAHHALAFLVLGFVFNLGAMPVNIGFAVVAGMAAQRLGTVQRAMRWMDRVAGVMFIAFGLKLALTEHPAT